MTPPVQNNLRDLRCTHKLAEHAKLAPSFPPHIQVVLPQLLSKCPGFPFHSSLSQQQRDHRIAPAACAITMKRMLCLPIASPASSSLQLCCRATPGICGHHFFDCKSPAGHKTNLRNSARRDALLRIFWTLGPLSGQTNHDCDVAREPTQQTNSTATTVSSPLPRGCRCDSPASSFSSCTSNFVRAPAQQSMSPSCHHQNILHLILL